MSNKGISREIITYLGFLLVIMFFLAAMFIYFNEEIISAAEKIRDVLRVI